MASSEAIFYFLKPSFKNPTSDFVLHRELLLRVRPESVFQCVGIHLEWNAFIPASAEKSSHVQIRKAIGAELAILFDMYKFMEQKLTGEWLLRDDYVIERNRCHAAKVGQRSKSHLCERRIEIRIGQTILRHADHNIAQ